LIIKEIKIIMTSLLKAQNLNLLAQSYKTFRLSYRRSFRHFFRRIAQSG
jgi:hypothetical protein